MSNFENIEHDGCDERQTEVKQAEPKITNADRIREMNNQQLASLIISMSKFEYKELMDWLNAEVK